MLERAHGARIDVDVRIQLHHADLEAARFQNGAQGSRGNAFAQRGNNTAGYTDKTRHRKAPSQTRRMGIWIVTRSHRKWGKVGASMNHDGSAVYLNTLRADSRER